MIADLITFDLALMTATRKELGFQGHAKTYKRHDTFSISIVIDHSQRVSASDGAWLSLRPVVLFWGGPGWQKKAIFFYSFFLAQRIGGVIKY